MARRIFVFVQVRSSSSMNFLTSKQIFSPALSLSSHRTTTSAWFRWCFKFVCMSLPLTNLLYFCFPFLSSSLSSSLSSLSKVQQVRQNMEISIELSGFAYLYQETYQLLHRLRGTGPPWNSHHNLRNLF